MDIGRQTSKELKVYYKIITQQPRVAESSRVLILQMMKLRHRETKGAWSESCHHRTQEILIALVTRPHSFFFLWLVVETQ